MLHRRWSLLFLQVAPFFLFNQPLPFLPLHQMFVFASPSARSTSAPSYYRSGGRGSQSRKSPLIAVCVLWWEPPSHSPLDQGKSLAPSATAALSGAVSNLVSAPRGCERPPSDVLIICFFRMERFFPFLGRRTRRPRSPSAPSA